nr:thioredoxin-disulfide reductase [Rhodococcus sp. (in: high G+C Gram-positive bacteria)]
MTRPHADLLVHDLIIIGSGPAGYTAALYAARAQLSPLVFEGPESGGALMTTTEVENFPGFPDGLDGPELMDRQRAQALRFGAKLVPDFVESVSLDGAVKTVIADGSEHYARAVILAMGSATRYLNLPREKALLGRGVSSCATCDGYFFRDQDVAVIGGGDSAMEEATFLTRFARSVTVVHRGEDLRASKIMVQRARSNDKIRWILASEVVDLHGDSDLTGIRLRDRNSGVESTVDVSGMFVAIGHEPRNQLVRDSIDLDGAGYVITEPHSSRTNLAGVFAAGDLVDHTYRQAITAAGSGCKAAIDAERWLASTEDSDGSHNTGARFAAAAGN